jgi:DNA modification methylase
VHELAAMPTDSVGLIVTSIPFGTQYEYSPSYHDFGHTDDDAHFWQQMDFLAPELLRVLQPGRVLAVHVKDRIRPGGLDRWSFQTVSPFHADAIHHYRRHGLAYMGMITVSTDVVRENAQTYRLGWSEQCKDGSKMSVGLPEYVLLFRKPPTDASNGYADVRVTKDKSEYSRARWQFDAHALWRSGGNRLLAPHELVGLSARDAFQRFKEYSATQVYDHDHAVAIAEARDAAGQLPPSFMLLQPTSHLYDVWTDVTRMRTLNGAQYAAGREMHICPLQFDIVDRLITRFSNVGDVVLDPFAGLMTVPLRAVALKRRGIGVELSETYYRDGVWHLRRAEEARHAPTLFDLLDPEGATPDDSLLAAPSAL